MGPPGLWRCGARPCQYGRLGTGLGMGPRLGPGWGYADWDDCTRWRRVWTGWGLAYCARERLLVSALE